MCAARVAILAGEFPRDIAAHLVSSVQAVLDNEPDTLLDTRNINHRVAEQRLLVALRQCLPDGHTITDNARVVDNARFTHDWVISSESTIVACELERIANRMEFDILKFQAFSRRQREG